MEIALSYRTTMKHAKMLSFDSRPSEALELKVIAKSETRVLYQVVFWITGSLQAH